MKLRKTYAKVFLWKALYSLYSLYVIWSHILRPGDLKSMQIYRSEKKLLKFIPIEANWLSNLE